MITKDRMINGLLSYIDAEVIPKLSTSGKWANGTGLVLMTPKVNAVADSLMNNSLVKATDVVTEDGMIDNKKLLDSLERSATKYGTLEMNIPLIGKFRFTASDVAVLKTYMADEEESHADLIKHILDKYS